MSGYELSGPGGAAAFVAALDRQAAVARRYDRAGAVIVIGFRNGNERAGRAAAAVLRARLRRTDLLARLSASELGVLLLEAGGDAATAVAADLVRLVAHATGDGAAAGVVSFPEAPVRPAGALLAEADGALALAWRLTPPVSAAPRHLRWPGSRAGRLGAALADGGMVLERSAVVDVRTGLTDHFAVGAHPREPGLAGAEGLRGAAERFGLGRGLDRWLVERALDAAERDASTLVVPIAGGAAGDAAFCVWLVGALAARPEGAGRLVLAVPEPAAVADPAGVRSLAVRMQEFGTRLAVDDFGVLGAVAILSRLPVHQVRLHPSLVRGLPGSDADCAVVLAAVQTAEALGAVPVATGVDGSAELTAVRGFGIAFAQGLALSLR